MNVQMADGRKIKIITDNVESQSKIGKIHIVDDMVVDDILNCPMDPEPGSFRTMIE